jgi:FdhD protein
VTMRTPGRDEDLALGFLLGEGIAGSAADVARIELRVGDAAAGRADEAHVTLTKAPDAAVRAALTRTHEIRSSCGICGVADVQAMLDRTPPLLPGVPQLTHAAVTRHVAALQQTQELFLRTGGCHGALVVDAGGRMLGAGEDVGRHNALDKAIGAAARGGADLARAIAVLSGRASRFSG